MTDRDKILGTVQDFEHPDLGPEIFFTSFFRFLLSDRAVHFVSRLTGNFPLSGLGFPDHLRNHRIPSHRNAALSRGTAWRNPVKTI